MPLPGNRRRRAPAPMLYDRCGRLFADNRSLVYVFDGCCDGHLGMVSPDGAEIYQIAFYKGSSGHYVMWEHPGDGDGTASFMHPGGQFTQQGSVSPAVAESVLAGFRPVHLGCR